MSSDTVWNMQSLPANDNINPYAYSVEVNGQFFVQTGKMIAYYGQLKFDALTVGSIQSFVAARFSAPLYSQDFMVVNGNGKCILGDRGFDINSYDLEDGNLTVRAGNLLGFDPSLQLKQSIVPGFLTLIGTGKFLASSNGAVHFVEPPIRVDPEALVGWADCPSPCHHYDAAYMQNMLGAGMSMLGFGGVSGEEHQFDFTGQGTVIMQSSEAVKDTAALVREMEAQVPLVGPAGLQRLQARIQQQLAGQQTY